MNGYLSEEALAAYSQLVAENLGLDFSEGETYDFTRCVRPDGTAYGTRGSCRKGKESGPVAKPQPTGSRRAAAPQTREKAATQMKAGRATYPGEKAARVGRGPHHAAVQQAKGELKGHLEELKDRQNRLKEFQRASQANQRAHRENPTRESRQRVREAERQLREHERHVARQERVVDQAYRNWARINNRNERAKMSPAQRAEARRVDALIKEYG